MIGIMIPKILGLVVELATSVAVDSAIKVATANRVKPITGFLIKGGTLLLSGIAATALGGATVKNAESLVQTITEMPDESSENKLQN